MEYLHWLQKYFKANIYFEASFGNQLTKITSNIFLTIPRSLAHRLINPFWTKKNNEFKLKLTDKSLAPHPFKTRWPDGRCVNVLTLCQYIDASFVGTWIEKAAVSSWKSVSVYWHVVTKGLTAFMEERHVSPILEWLRFLLKGKNHLPLSLGGFDKSRHHEDNYRFTQG